MDEHPEDTGSYRDVYCGDLGSFDREADCEVRDQVQRVTLRSLYSLDCLLGHEFSSLQMDSICPSVPDDRIDGVWLVECKVYE